MSVIERVCSALAVWDDVVYFGAVGPVGIFVVEWCSAVWAVVDALVFGFLYALLAYFDPLPGAGA